jgi:hypothetical protein
MLNEMTKAMLQGLTDAQLEEIAVLISVEQYRRRKPEEPKKPRGSHSYDHV